MPSLGKPFFIVANANFPFFNALIFHHLELKLTQHFSSQDEEWLMSIAVFMAVLPCT